MEKEFYSEAEMEIVRLKAQDIITTSGFPEDNTDEDGGIVLPDDEW